jgi:hypothetical protein
VKRFREIGREPEKRGDLVSFNDVNEMREE